MKEFLNVIGCGTVYFMIVYLFVIRRQVRPIIPWAVCIGGQVICTVCFYQLVAVANWIFPEKTFGYLGKGLTSGLLLFGNLALIFIMFGPVLNKIKNKNSAPMETQKDFKISPIHNSSVLSPLPNEEPVQEEDITMDFIEKTIAAGRTEEALKYLKMIAYCSKDEKSRAAAAKRIEELKKVK